MIFYQPCVTFWNCDPEHLFFTKEAIHKRHPSDDYDIEERTHAVMLNTTDDDGEYLDITVTQFEIKDDCFLSVGFFSPFDLLGISREKFYALVEKKYDIYKVLEMSMWFKNNTQDPMSIELEVMAKITKIELEEE